LPGRGRDGSISYGRRDIDSTATRPLRTGWASSDLAQRRDLFLNLVRTDLAVRYKTTGLGALWFLLNPLLMAGILTLVFQHVVRLDIPRYPVFVLAALLPWTFFQMGLGNAATSVTRAAALVKRSSVPRVLLPLSAIGASLVHFGLSLLILFGVMLVLGTPFTGYLLLLPLAILLQLACLTGLGLLTAGLNVVYRDVEHVLAIALRLGFYLTPSFYPVAYVPSGWRDLYLLNPTAAIIEIYRRTLAEGGPVPVRVWASTAVTSLALLLLGGWLFRRLEPRFDDHV
jgi:lipopolysaccharide transport system permease protein